MHYSRLKVSGGLLPVIGCYACIALKRDTAVNETGSFYTQIVQCYSSRLSYYEVDFACDRNSQTCRQ